MRKRPHGVNWDYINERIESDLLSPMVDRTFNTIHKFGLIPEPPAKMKKRRVAFVEVDFGGGANREAYDFNLQVIGDALVSILRKRHIPYRGIIKLRLEATVERSGK